MQMAMMWGGMSRCVRKKVGCIVVKDGCIISDGFNGTPSGMDNACENDQGETNWWVIHAEENAICKLAANGGNSVGATIYITLSPCRNCSKLLLQSGIRRVVYMSEHSDTSGIDFLRSNSVEVSRLDF